MGTAPVAAAVSGLSNSKEQESQNHPSVRSETAFLSKDVSIFPDCARISGSVTAETQLRAWLNPEIMF